MADHCGRSAHFLNAWTSGPFLPLRLLQNWKSKGNVGLESSHGETVLESADHQGVAISGEIKDNPLSTDNTSAIA